MKGIYTIRHIETDRYYVGSSVHIERRWKEHKHRIRNGTHPAKHLMRAFQKHGSDAFVFEILEECDVSDEAIRIERETFWINRLQPVFNVAPVAGSILGLKRSSEARANMSAAQKGRISPFRGIPRSPEVKAKISQGSKGRIHSELHRARISAALKGRISPRKGVILSPEIRAKISASKTRVNVSVT